MAVSAPVVHRPVHYVPVRRHQRSSGFAFALLSLTTLMAMGYLTVQTLEWMVRSKIASVKQEIKQLERAQQEQRFQLFQLKNSERIAQFAKQAGMVLPEETVFVSVVLPQEVRPPSESPQAKGFVRLHWERMSDLLGRLFG